MDVDVGVDLDELSGGHRRPAPTKLLDGVACSWAGEAMSAVGGEGSRVRGVGASNDDDGWSGGGNPSSGGCGKGR